MRERIPPLEAGSVHGCWTVVREVAPDHFGRRRYLARASCCSAERVKLGGDIKRAVPKCVHCKGNGKGKKHA